MKKTLAILLLLLVVGCGKNDKITVEKYAEDNGMKLEDTAAASTVKPKQDSLLWEYETEGKWYAKPVTSPVQGSGGTVYFGSGDSKIYALDGRTGNCKWEYNTDLSLTGHPTTASNGTVYIASQGFNYGELHALDGTTGERKWLFRTAENTPPHDCGIGADGTVYVGSGPLASDGSSVSCNVFALDGKTGEMKWKFEAQRGFWHPPAISPDGTVYFSCNDAKVYALDGTTGAMQWKSYLGGQVVKSMAIGAAGVVYAGSQAGLYALDGNTGETQWEFTPAGGVHGSLAIDADGTIYFGAGDKHVYAVDGQSGEKRWESQPGESTAHSPAIGADGTVYFGCHDNTVYALDGKTGAKRSEFFTDGSVKYAITLGTDGTLYIGSDDKRVRAFATTSNGPVQSPWPMFGQNPQHTSRAAR